MFPGQRTGEGSGSLPLLLPWLRAKLKYPLLPESSTGSIGLLDQNVNRREIIHLSCSYIHHTCWLLCDCILFGMLRLYLLGFGSRYLLVLKTLQVSKTLEYDFGMWSQLVLEDGMVPVTNMFSAYLFQSIFMFVNISVYYILCL